MYLYILRMSATKQVVCNGRIKVIIQRLVESTRIQTNTLIHTAYERCALANTYSSLRPWDRYSRIRRFIPQRPARSWWLLARLYKITKIPF